MLNFRNTNILFIALLVSLIGYHIIYPVHLLIYFILIIAYSLILFYGCFDISSNFFINVICSANTIEKEIAISFDDGPVKNCTPEILQILKANNVKAAFFCIGNRIAGKEKIFVRLHEEGHLIGNHSYSHHFWFDIFSSRKMLADLKMMDTVMEETIGFRAKLFRPPYGVTNPNLRNAIIKGNYVPVGWNVRSMDTILRNEKKLLNKITKSLSSGAIFLFHDTSQATIAILPMFIRHVTQKGYKIVRLDKMLNLQAYA